MRVAQFFDPLLQDVHVAKVAESPENFLPRLLHLLPGGIGIHGHQAVGEGAAAADCYSQIMNRISVETCSRVLTLYEYSLHPGAQPDLELGFCRDRGWTCGHRALSLFLANYCRVFVVILP